MTESVHIRPATEADASALLAIYRPFVETTTVSFEVIAPTVDEFATRIARALAGWQWLVAERDGRCIGYAYGGLHRERTAYRWSTEVSAYVHPDYQRQGVGCMLYMQLLDDLAQRGYCNAYAGITLPNEGSVALHRSVGFEQIGVFRSVGRKFGKWHDVAWFQRFLRDSPPFESGRFPGAGGTAIGVVSGWLALRPRGDSMPNRRTAILFGGGLLVVALGRAQQPPKAWRIGFLSGGPRPADGAPPAALRQALAELGYVDGKNLTFTGRWAEGNGEQIPGFAAELVGIGVDLLITIGGAAAEAAKNATSTVPIVFVAPGDVAETGLVTNLARPGGNITGISDPATELSAKRLGLLKEALPNATRVAVIWNENDRAMTLRKGEVEKAARILRVTVQPLGVRKADDIDAALSAMSRERPDAVFVVSDALTNINRRRILEFAAAHHLPAMYEFGSYVKDGGLMSYGPNIDEMWRRAAIYVDRILKGAKPGELAVEQPTRYYFLLNLKTAKALDLTIPQPLLLRADEVIQ